MESILNSIKKLLGPEEDYNHFDTDIIIHINTALMDLNQLGVGPSEGFFIEDDSYTWNDFVQPELQGRVEAIKTYVYLRVKLLFDSSSLSSAQISALERQIDRLESRINTAYELAKSES